MLQKKSKWCNNQEIIRKLSLTIYLLQSEVSITTKTTWISLFWQAFKSLMAFETGWRFVSKWLAPQKCLFQNIKIYRKYKWGFWNGFRCFLWTLGLVRKEKSWIIKSNRRTRKNWKCDGIQEKDVNDWDYITETM